MLSGTTSHTGPGRLIPPELLEADDDGACATDPDRYARQVTRDAGSSFYWAMRLLPPPRRRAMFAIYAFCRKVDDIADGTAPGAEKRARLEAWRKEIARIYDGVPETRTGKALLPAIRKFGMRREDFLAVVDGMEMDAVGLPRGPSMAELETYCARVAGAVGLLSLHAFGAVQAPCREFALELGAALQLTNILRDLAQDAGMGRCYLPAELLDRHGIATRDPGEVLAHPAIAAVCYDLADIAEQHYANARRLLKSCPRRALRPAVVMMEHYARILARLAESGWRTPERRMSLSKLKKLWIAVRYGLI